MPPIPITRKKNPIEDDKPPTTNIFPLTIDDLSLFVVAHDLSIDLIKAW